MANIVEPTICTRSGAVDDPTPTLSPSAKDEPGSLRPPTTFFSLPRELRDAIYEEYFGGPKRVLFVGHRKLSGADDERAWPSKTPLLRTNRQIHAEAARVFYASRVRVRFIWGVSPKPFLCCGVHDGPLGLDVCSARTDVYWATESVHMLSRQFVRFRRFQLEVEYQRRLLLPQHYSNIEKLARLLERVPGIEYFELTVKGLGPVQPLESFEQVVPEFETFRCLRNVRHGRLRFQLHTRDGLRAAFSETGKKYLEELRRDIMQPVGEGRMTRSFYADKKKLVSSFSSREADEEQEGKKTEDSLDTLMSTQK